MMISRRMIWMMKELKEALLFLMSTEFWRMAVLWTFSLLYSYLLLFSRKFLCFSINNRFQTRQSIKRHYPNTSEDLKPICIITGATSGLGAAAALALSERGFYVVLVGRARHLLQKVDLSSIQSIINFRNSLQIWLQDSKLHSSVQLLINNAGILATSSRFTSQGYDQLHLYSFFNGYLLPSLSLMIFNPLRMMATNYVGPFFLTQMLLPLLKNSPMSSRIVNVSSFTHRCVFDLQVDEDTVSGKCFMELDRYPCARIYEYSKLCLLLFSYELHRRLCLVGESSNVTVIVADPGVVKTNIMREIPSYISHGAFTILKLLRLLKVPQDGVSCVLDAALASPEISGVYFFGGKGRTVKSSACSYNTGLAEELWTTSFNMFLKSQLALEEERTNA